MSKVAYVFVGTIRGLRSVWILISLALVWNSLNAAEDVTPISVEPIALGGYGHYVLLPTIAPDLKLPRGVLLNLSDRILGRVTPLLNGWNDPDKLVKEKPEIGIQLVVDKFNGVSSGARAMWGALAGGADMIAHIDLIERPSGKILKQQPFSVSKKGEMSPSGAVSDFLVYDKLVARVLDYLIACHETPGS